MRVTDKDLTESYAHVAPSAPSKRLDDSKATLAAVKAPTSWSTKPSSGQPANTNDVSAPAPAPVPRSGHLISVTEDAIFALNLSDPISIRTLPRVAISNAAAQAHAGDVDDEREVVLGLDFGTSCVKVVIGDAALGKAFAVPFCLAEGIEKFLLPTRLYQTGALFSLDEGTHSHRDLKLSLLAAQGDPVLRLRVVAFMALVIRRARSWFLAEHEKVYARTSIFWKLTVGLPAAQHLQTPFSELFEHLSRAAWVAAGACGALSDVLVKSILEDVISGVTTGDDAEFAVVPEIAAQIYGFVVSNSFDKNAENIDLMADVGAGTIDSALFHVKPSKGGRWDFEFFTSIVEPNGVSNLHRHRVNWWQTELEKIGAPQHLLDKLVASKMITDPQRSTPETFTEYFRGVRAKFEGSAETPDETIFKQRILQQVRGKSFWRAWKDGLLPQQQLTNIPFFMCGGGVRMQYYKKLVPALATIPGCTWLKAVCRSMDVPQDLIAEGVSKDEYDRLSVAYGLSRLEVGKIVKALPQPKVDNQPVGTWRDNYIDKDQC